MSTRELLEKIESLSAEKRAEIEELVDSLARPHRVPEPNQKSSPTPVFDRIRQRRERLYREQGHFDTLPLIRELRENGGR